MSLLAWNRPNLVLYVLPKLRYILYVIALKSAYSTTAGPNH